MPSLGSHMARARTIADRLRLPEIDADRGAYYLGSTAPDIRVITRRERSVTHFFELDDLHDQDSVSRMFAEHPGLAAPAGLDAATTAFIAGYLTHLVLDEAFIGEVYRPNFGAHSERDDDPKSNVLDRALQYELDRRDREDRAAMEEIREALAATTPPAVIPFIAGEHLVEWTTVSQDIATHPPDFGRFRRMMTRHLEQAGYGLDEINSYCAEPAVLVAEAFRVVDEERIERFWHHAEERMTDRVRSYLR
jgi:hypothetical protein